MRPLHGVTIIEIASIGPGPFCGMVLADLGADVIRVERADTVVGDAPEPSFDLMNRGRRSIGVDLKHPRGAETVLRMVSAADGLIEGFRPGAAERLGIGPVACLERNPKLVYGRMTGWGQEGPLARTAGHDINYIALSGALHAIGRAGERPVPPLNLVGDFGGGGMLLAVGMVAGLFAAARSGDGQVVDAAMVDGSALLTTMFHGMRAAGLWTDQRGVNLLDSGAHFYEVYETADGRHVAVGAIEPQFYAELIARLGLDAEELPHQLDVSQWPAMKERFAALFKSRTRDEWAAVFEGSDACVAPVLSMAEAPHHPHNRARKTFVEVEGIVQPAPAPRFGSSPAPPTGETTAAGRHTDEVLTGFGFTPEEIADLREEQAVR